MNTAHNMQAHGRRRRAQALLSLALSLSLVACADEALKGSYSQASVQPVTAEKTDDGQAIIHFTMPGETLFYSAGLSYRIVGDELQVVIDRCHIQSKCKTMAKAQRKQGTTWGTQASVPFNQQRIVMIHADAKQQIYP